MENDSYAAKVRSCVRYSLSKLCTLSAVKNISLIMLSVVSSKVMLVNSPSTSWLAIKFLELHLLTSLVKMNDKLCTHSQLKSWNLE